MDGMSFSSSPNSALPLAVFHMLLSATTSSSYGAPFIEDRKRPFSHPLSSTSVIAAIIVSMRVFIFVRLILQIYEKIRVVRNV
jgi:multisubunit Na+/H+ antiporter MnhC subunit